MPTRKAHAVWNGNLKQGKGDLQLGDGADRYQGNYSFQSRFESGSGTNPEELLAAAHAGCFSMALSARLGEAGFEPKRISTEASVDLKKTADGFRIAKILLETEADVPGIQNEQLEKMATEAVENCPVSKALAGAEIALNATLSS